MYSSFWDNLKNAFNRRDNSLYKLMAINLIAFFCAVGYTSSADA
jgi:hypothetical protein